MLTSGNSKEKNVSYISRNYSIDVDAQLSSVISQINISVKFYRIDGQKLSPLLL